MSETTAARITTVSRVYLIIALFVGLIFCLVGLIQVQMDALTAIRAYVGGEGLWAKAQKEAVRSIEHYVVSHDEADYLTYRRQIQVPLGDRRARLELQKEKPDIAVALEGFVQGRNHPDDLESAVRFFRRFQHSAYMSQVIGHWTTGDRLIAELNGVAEALHEEIASGRNKPEAIRSYLTRLDDLNRQVTVEEDLFSSTLAEASRWVHDASRNLTYAIGLLFVALGVGLCWPLITRIRATENALSGSEEQFRSIFEHVDDIIYIIEADGTFSAISPSSERTLGWSADEWIGRPFALIVHPDDLPRMQELFMKAQAGESLPVFQVRILTKAGGYLESEIAVNLVHRGDSIAMLGVVRDITERKRAEEAMKKANIELSLFRQLLDNSSDAIEVIDPITARFLDVNERACRELGYSREELLSMSVFDIDPSFSQDSKKMIDEQMQKSGAVRYEGLHRRKDGSSFAVEVSVVSANLDKPYGLCVARDITERKRGEEKIRKLNEELEEKVQERTKKLLEVQEELVRKEKLAVLGQVAGSVGHELRNPLGVMSNAVYFLQTVLSDADETTKEYLNIIKDEIAGSERIVSDLLDAVRTQPPQIQTVGIAEVLKQTLRKCSVPPSVTVKLNIPEMLSPLRVDPLQIQQVLRNLISNGIEAMPEGGTLEIRAVGSSQDGTVTVSVRDSGSGIAPEVLPRMFQPLFTTKARGIGLGLVVVKNLTEANGGTVKVESEVGKGSVFAVTLPAADEKGISI